MIHTQAALTPVPSHQTVPLFWVLTGMMLACHCEQRCHRRARGCNRGNGVSAPSIPTPALTIARISSSLGYSARQGLPRLLPFVSVTTVSPRRFPGPLQP